MPTIPKPLTGEYPPAYARYLSRVAEGDLPAALIAQLDGLRPLAARLDDAAARHRYAEGKWSVKELFAHLIASERAFGLRAVFASRNTPVTVSPHDRDAYIRTGGFDAVAWADLWGEFRHARLANAHFFRQLPEEAWTRQSSVAGAAVSVRALGYMLLGHVDHHLHVLRASYRLG